MTLLFATLLLWAAPLAMSPTEEDASLRLMSFNIRFANPGDGEDRWEKRREMVVRMLRQEKPDLLGLQEALKIQLDELAQALPEYAAVGVGRDDGKSAGEHSQLLFRKDRFGLEEHGTFWLSDTPTVPGSKHWGNNITRICTWARLKDRKTDRAFYVYNLHLDHQSQPSREKSAALLLKALRERRKTAPVIVMGDFNAGEDNPAVTALLKAQKPPLRDTFRAKLPEAKEVGTFHGFSGTPGKEKIDYIFVSPEFVVEAADIVRTQERGRYPSDHFPVTARCRLEP